MNEKRTVVLLLVVKLMDVSASSPARDKTLVELLKAVWEDVVSGISDHPDESGVLFSWFFLQE
jgi:hypothetical protein